MAAVVNPGGAMQPAQPAPKPYTVTSKTRPANPASGGHYVSLGNNVWQQIHATGPGQWAPGPPKATTPAKTTTSAATAAPKAANPYANPLYQPTSVLSGKPLADYTQALTNVQYDPAIRQLSQQIAQNAAQGAAAQKQTAGYFAQLLPYAQQSAQDVGGINAQAQTALQKIASDAQARIDQTGSQVSAPQAQLAGQGLAGGGTQRLAEGLASAKLAASNQATSGQQYAQNLGTAAQTLAAQNLGTYALRGQERLGQIAQATRLAQQPVEQQLATKQSEKAQAYGTNLMAARQQQYQNWVTAQGLGLKSAAIASTAATAAANQAAQNKRTAETIAGQNTRNQANIDARALQGTLDRQSSQSIADQNNQTRKDIAAGRNAAKNGGKMTPGAQRQTWTHITGLQARLRQLTTILQSWGATPQNARVQAWHALRDGRVYALDSKTGKWSWRVIPPVGDIGLLNAAYNTFDKNSSGLSPGDVNYLHGMGFTIGSLMPIATTRSNLIGGVTGAAQNLIPHF
jgi:hypothetical protein